MDRLTLIRGINSGLKYFRYQTIKYLKEDVKGVYKQADMVSEQLAMLMKTLLVKRIDSSFDAFKVSLQRYHQKCLLRTGISSRVPNAAKNEWTNTAVPDSLKTLFVIRSFTLSF